MDHVETEIVGILRNVFGRAVGDPLDASSALLGTVAELDSMAVVAILTSIEERFEFNVDDDEVDSNTFATIGTLAQFVRAKLAA